jgi:hypothetical protein
MAIHHTRRLEVVAALAEEEEEEELRGLPQLLPDGSIHNCTGGPAEAEAMTKAPR